MKKELMLILLLLPVVTFAQATDGGANFMSALVAFAIMIGLFFLFRSVLLWYWKVDTIVKNQQETNDLLKSVLKQLESKNNQ